MHLAKGQPVKTSCIYHSVPANSSLKFFAALHFPLSLQNCVVDDFSFTSSYFTAIAGAAFGSFGRHLNASSIPRSSLDAGAGGSTRRAELWTNCMYGFFLASRPGTAVAFLQGGLYGAGSMIRKRISMLCRGGQPGRAASLRNAACGTWLKSLLKAPFGG